MSWFEDNNEKIVKILALNIGIGVVDTILFSPGLLGIQIIATSAIAAAFSANASKRWNQEGEIIWN